MGRRQKCFLYVNHGWYVIKNCSKFKLTNLNYFKLHSIKTKDPDVPSRKTNILAEWHHWIVVNIPGNEVSKGETILEYVGSGPPEDTGLHRYVLLVFKQQHKQDFNETKLTNKYVFRTNFL